MTKLAPEWVRTSDPVIRSPARYRWTTAPALRIPRNIRLTASPNGWMTGVKMTDWLERVWGLRVYIQKL